jgi:hypothetical protein
MAIQFDFQMEEHERRLLGNILGCSEEEFDISLSKFGKAAIEEYVRMFLGQKVFTRGADIKEYRLLLLIKTVFDNEIPEEQKVCDLFQMTSTESRSLIRSVMSKYQYELKEAITKTLVDKVSNVIYDESESYYTVDIKTENIVSELNRILGTVDGSLPPIARKKGTVSTYIIRTSALNKLLTCTELKEGILNKTRNTLGSASPEINRRQQIKHYTINTENKMQIHMLEKVASLYSGQAHKITRKENTNEFTIKNETYEFLNQLQ